MRKAPLTVDHTALYLALRTTAEREAADAKIERLGLAMPRLCKRSAPRVQQRSAPRVHSEHTARFSSGETIHSNIRS